MLYEIYFCFYNGILMQIQLFFLPHRAFPMIHNEFVMYLDTNPANF